MNIEKLRCEFEEAFKQRLNETGQGEFSELMLTRIGQHQEYRDRFAASAWWAWQASRAAIEVELPASLADDMTLIQSIKSLGLRVKP